MKIVISDTKTGKTYQKELEKEKEGRIVGSSIGDEIDGGIVGAAGYKLKITGGSDISGFPMRNDLPGTVRANLLLTKGIGFRAKKKGERQKRRIIGKVISDQIYQVNTLVIEAGATPLEELFPKEEKKK